MKHKEDSDGEDFYEDDSEDLDDEDQDDDNDNDEDPYFSNE